jgi:shikimate kinase
MGTGKSSVGPILARMMRKDFVELDMEIEKAAGSTISDIFTLHGEDHFRKIEKEILRRALERENIVLSCGGGAIIDIQNRRLLKKKSIVVWLDASAGVIAERLKDDGSRPLLADNSKESIVNLLEKRLGLYREASEIRVQTDDLDINQVALYIAEKIGASYDI